MSAVAGFFKTDARMTPTPFLQYPPDLKLRPEVAVSDRLTRLRTLRDQLTAWLESSAADRAQLALRLTAVLEQIEACEKAQPQTKGTVLDELAARRQAAGEGSPARSQKRR